VNSGGGVRGQRGFGPGAIKVFYIAILLLIIFPGCATKDAIKRESDVNILRERVIAYWNYKMEGDLVKSYEYESPLNKMTLTNYIKRYSDPAIRYKSFEVESINKVDDDVADVRLTIVPIVKVPGARAFEYTTTITERWVSVKDEWYHTSKKVGNKLIQKEEEGGDVKN